MTVLESLKRRVGLINSGAASFFVVIGAPHLAGGEPFVQPQADAGIAIGVALAALFLLVKDRRVGAMMPSGPSAQSRNV